ncbi:MAG: hypothetical protein KDC95_22560 [Planctomycetes bacterium]|nr:hypothetical protein [Planctomycetota bacterium]
MSLTTISLSALATAALFFASTVFPSDRDAEASANDATVSATPATPRRHCQVPCGIYGDKMRIDMFMEDAATIEKAMKSLLAMDQEDHPSKNQMVRWVMAKDDHAQAIQDRVSAYWLAQRIKVPGDGADAAAMSKYGQQLVLMHRITVSAMKCKQTTETSHVEALRRLVLEFSKTYFSAEDLKHIEEHHKGDADHK